MEKPFLIAEIGINHNGDVNIAKKLIDEAIIAGFDAVKFQKRDINLVYSKDILDTPRESPWGKTTREQKNGLEFDFNAYKDIDNYCKLKKIEWFASAWDLNSLKFLNNFNLKYNKIASAMIVDKVFLKEVAKQRKYTFISTGMSTISDIELAVNIFKENNCPFELMHSVSTYPMAVEDANLLTINSLKRYFDCKVGYSGHEDGVVVSLAAISLGISSLERHITLSRSMYGSDQAASLEPRGMRELISGLKIIIKAFGEEKLGFVTAEEAKVAKKLRAHIKQ
jgi:N-acetylneuraminate synthase